MKNCLKAFWKKDNYLIPAYIIVENLCWKRFFVCNFKCLYVLLKLSEENMIISAPNQDKCLKNVVKFSSTNEHLFYICFVCRQQLCFLWTHSSLFVKLSYFSIITFSLDVTFYILFRSECITAQRYRNSKLKIIFPRNFLLSTFQLFYLSILCILVWKFQKRKIYSPFGTLNLLGIFLSLSNLT